MSEIHQAPRSAQLAVIGLYTAIVVAGSYAAHTALGAHSEHYFARKSNILNQALVKRGWFWFTLVFWASCVVRRNSPPHTLKRPRVYHTVARYAAATLWWVLFAQWFLGPPVMDRIFMLTGGSCSVELPDVEPPGPGGAILPVPPPAELKTSWVCKRLGGLWDGGHDPSGHVFLLVHSSIVLWMEILPDLWSRGPLRWSTKGPLLLLSVWAVMLFFTVTYFHSFGENLSGLAFGVAEAFVVYFVGERASWGWVFGVNAQRPQFPRRLAPIKAQPGAPRVRAPADDALEPSRSGSI